MNAMKVLRRTHMYAGLFLVPWVAMYGMSAFVFNHGGWFAGTESDSSRWTLDGAAAQLPEPLPLARKVVTAVNARETSADGASPWRLMEDQPPRFQGSMNLQGQNNSGGSVVLSFDPATAAGTTMHEPAPPMPQIIQLTSNEAPQLRAAQAAILAAATQADNHLREVQFGEAWFPSLSFHMQRGTEHRIASYDPRTGQVELAPESAAVPLRPSSFLTSLHRSHGYPENQEGFSAVRTVRALFVDAMAGVMCFWALSGLLMWFQQKPIRRTGWMVVAATGAIVIVVWGGMYRFFTSGL